MNLLFLGTPVSHQKDIAIYIILSFVLLIILVMIFDEWYLRYRFQKEIIDVRRQEQQAEKKYQNNFNNNSNTRASNHNESMPTGPDCNSRKRSATTRHTSLY